MKNCIPGITASPLNSAIAHIKLNRHDLPEHEISNLQQILHCNSMVSKSRFQKKLNCQNVFFKKGPNFIKFSLSAKNHDNHLENCTKFGPSLQIFFCSKLLKIWDLSSKKTWKQPEVKMDTLWYIAHNNKFGLAGEFMTSL